VHRPPRVCGNQRKEAAGEARGASLQAPFLYLRGRAPLSERPLTFQGLSPSFYFPSSFSFSFIYVSLSLSLSLSLCLSGCVCSRLRLFFHARGIREIGSSALRIQPEFRAGASPSYLQYSDLALTHSCPDRIIKISNCMASSSFKALLTTSYTNLALQIYPPAHFVVLFSLYF
jgi:hypothetical protein